jgi:phage terminase Nu1 subunit (DNA packaging protein)
MKSIILASLVLAVTSGATFAATPWIDARQNAQKHRIVDGIASGRLNYHESLQLAHGQAHVQQLENKAKANGVVTPFERARINFAQSVQSARIFRKKHN